MTWDHLARTVALALIGVFCTEWGARELWAFHGRYGWPWRRTPGTNGRWRTDLLVAAFLLLIATICLLSVATLWHDGWVWHRRVVTALLLVFVGVLVALRWSAQAERIKAKHLAEPTVARLEVVVDRAEHVTDRLEETAEQRVGTAAAVIERAAVVAAELLDKAEVTADHKAADRARKRRDLDGPCEGDDAATSG